MEAPKHGFPQDPTSPSSSSSSSSSSSNPTRTPLPPPPPLPAAASPKPIPRTIESAPYPTTFVQADTASFKQVVQMLTGAAGAEASARTAKNGGGGGGNGSLAAPCRPATAPKKPAFKLYERRSSLKNLKMISPLPVATAAASPRKAAPPEILSPSVLDFPSLALSPVTPLIPDPFNRSPAAPASTEEAERAAIAEKGFFLHPSPRGAERPRLLPLFPVTSPRMASATPSSERGLRI